jgi:hypothetical protein
MSILSAVSAYAWYGVAFLWRPGGSLPHARGGAGRATGARPPRGTQGRFDSSPPHQFSAAGQIGAPDERGFLIVIVPFGLAQLQASDGVTSGS